MVRYIKTPLLYNFHAPQADIPGISWQAMTPENVMPFSALALSLIHIYKIINGIKGNSSNSEEVKNPYIAEARFMRGVAFDPVNNLISLLYYIV